MESQVWNRLSLSLFQEMGLLKGGAVAIQLRAHLEECGRRYEASRDAIIECKKDLTADICELRAEQGRMDDRNRKAIEGVFRLLWAVAGGIVLLLFAVVGVLAKAQLHIPG
jgi:hypothetical protein